MPKSTAGSLKEANFLVISRILSTVMMLGYLSVSMLWSQTPPSSRDRAEYSGLFSSALSGNVTEARLLISEGANPDIRDSHGRTPLHVAAYYGHQEFMRALVELGADPNALDQQRYDIVTIAAVADDLTTLETALEIGGSPKNITSPYDGTALIAAAHLGHEEVVKTLSEAGAPLDHINNLGWTALIEAIVLGDGGTRHTDTVEYLLDAGANPNIADRNGQTPLQLAEYRGYDSIISLLLFATKGSVLR